MAILREERREDRTGMLRDDLGRDERRAGGGTGVQFYEDYGFQMTPEQYQMLLDQQQKFIQGKEDLQKRYEEASTPYKEKIEELNIDDEDIEKLWKEQDLIGIRTPYKGRSGVRGYVPKDMAGQLVDALATNKDLKGRVSVVAPKEMAQGAYDYAQNLLAEGGPISSEQAKEFSRLMKEETGSQGFSVDWPIMITDRGHMDIWYQLEAEAEGGEGYGDPLQSAQEAIAQGYKPFDYRGEMQNWVDQMEKGEIDFNVRGKEYDRAVFYEMPKILKDVKNQWSNSVKQQYLETRQEYEQGLAVLDNELAEATAQLQGYIDEFDTGVSGFRSEYERKLAEREKLFGGLK